MKYYCIGIKGTGMSTLAQLLYDLGNDVSGYDDCRDHRFTEEGLEKRGIQIYYDHDHSLDKDTIVTYSVAFSPDHEEINRVKEMGLTIKKYNELLGEIVDMFETIGVSGTHGKTSTSSMIRHILEVNSGCNYFIGAGDGYVDKDNKYFVIESDEFNKHFLAYHPTHSIITNIEKEHLECYNGIEDIRNSFKQFASQTKNNVVVCGDNEEIRKIDFNKKVIYYGFNDDNDIIIRNEKYEEEGSSFDLYNGKEFYGSYYIPLYGSHMVLNATSAIIMCKLLGFNEEVIKDSLSTFENAKRRFAITDVGTTTIIDDYAHHPTEIEVTLKAAKQKYPNRKIVAIFKPNTYSRIKDFKQEFVNALSIADKVFLTKVDSNREKQEDYPGINSELIIESIPNGELISEDNVERLMDYRDGVLCFMSCASVSKIINETEKKLRNN